MTGRSKLRMLCGGHAVSISVIVAMIVATNWLALTGVFNDDPELFVSGLGRWTRGPWGGSPNWYDPTIGFVVQALGHASAEQWLHGVVPWWNAYSGAGMPQAALLQSYALFLPFVLLLHFHAGWLWLRVIFQALSAVSAYLFCVQISLCRSASIAAGMLYGCMGSFILIAHAPAGTFMFIPLLLLGIEHAAGATVARRPGGWSVVVISIAYSFYAGFPETAFLADLLGGVWASARLLEMPHECRGRFLVKLGLAAALGLLLTLPALIPFVQYLHLGQLGDHESIYAKARLEMAGLPMELLPLIFGPFGMVPQGLQSSPAAHLLQQLSLTEGNVGAWFGMSPVLLAIVGFLIANSNLRICKWALFGWIAIWQARMFGFPPVTEAMDLIPAMHFIDVARFSGPSCDFAIIVLAAFGLDALRRGARLSPSGFYMAGLTSLTLLAVCIFLVWQYLAALESFSPIYRILSAAYLLLTLFLLAIALISIMLSTSPVGPIMLCALLVLNAILGYGLSQAAGARTGSIDKSGIAFIQTRIGLQRVFTLGVLEPNYGAQYGVAQIDYNLLPVPKLWTDFIASNLDNAADPIVFNGDYVGRPSGAPSEAEELQMHLGSYEAVGVKYILAKPGNDPFAGMSPEPKLVFYNGTMDIYQLPNPSPYFFSRGTLCTIKAKDRLTLTADCKGSATLVRQELYYPGWHAVVNGQPELVTQAAPIFQSIPLQAGHNDVTFYYRPTHIRLAVAVACLAAFIWLALGVAARFPATRATKFIAHWI